MKLAINQAIHAGVPTVRTYDPMFGIKCGIRIVSDLGRTAIRRHVSYIRDQGLIIPTVAEMFAISRSTLLGHDLYLCTLGSCSQDTKVYHRPDNVPHNDSGDTSNAIRVATFDPQNSRIRSAFTSSMSTVRCLSIDRVASVSAKLARSCGTIDNTELLRSAYELDIYPETMTQESLVQAMRMAIEIDRRKSLELRINEPYNPLQRGGDNEVHD